MLLLPNVKISRLVDLNALSPIFVLSPNVKLLTATPSKAYAPISWTLEILFKVESLLQPLNA